MSELLGPLKLVLAGAECEELTLVLATPAIKRMNVAIPNPRIANSFTVGLFFDVCP